jgi:hypothetical protein
VCWKPQNKEIHEKLKTTLDKSIKLFYANRSGSSQIHGIVIQLPKQEKGAQAPFS